MTFKSRFIYTIGLALLLTGCSSLPKTPDGFEEKIVETEKMNFLTWHKKDISSQKTLRFYIEGNGNPTPPKAMALSLAEKDKTKNIVVLTRPCQYLKNEVCKNENIWGKERYNPDILNEMYELSLFYVKKYRPQHVEFVAYSDAAPIAFSLAQRYGRAKKVVTIGGVLDINSYVRQNNLEQIKHKDFINKSFVAQTPQIHYVGSNDKTVTKSMTERYISNLVNPKKVIIKEVKGMTHDGWDSVKLDY